VRMVLGRMLLLAGTGLAVGIGGALFATRVLGKMLYEVRPDDPSTMIAVGSILAASAIAASWLPARRAARVDPLVALRWE
jgi:putative ABC transport system permease protein